MTYPNAGVSAAKFTNLFSVSPEFIKDLFDAFVEASDYSKRVIHRYPNRGINSITGASEPALAEPCACFDKNWGAGGKSGFNKCSQCHGAMVKGGWVNEKIDCFFWRQIPPGLAKTAKIFAVPLPIVRDTVVIYVKSEIEIYNGELIINEIKDKRGNVIGEEELQALNVRQIEVGGVIIWQWIQCQRQAADVSTTKRVKR